MLVRTHILFALLCAVVYLKWFPRPNTLIFVMIVLAATLLPDLDEKQSTLGRRLKPVSWTLQFFLGHRGIWHSLWIPLILYLILLVYMKNYAMAVVVGYVAHLIADSLTKEGINFLYPLQFHVRGFIRTGSVLEQVFAVGCVVALAYLIFR